MDSKGALAELKSFQGSRKGAGDYYTQFQNELGVGDAQTRSNDIRSQIRNTEGALRGVNASVAGRTRGNLVTEAQRARLEGLERAPIAQELGTLSGTLADEQQNYRDLLGQATTRAGQAYQTDADKLASLESNYGKLYQQERDAEAADQWRRKFEEDNRQFAEQMAESRRSTDAMKARIASMNQQPQYSAPMPQPAAPTSPQSIPTLRAPGILSGSNIASASKGGYFADLGKNISQGWQNVQKYGPLALFGKGTLF